MKVRVNMKRLLLPLSTAFNIFGGVLLRCIYLHFPFFIHWQTIEHRFLTPSDRDISSKATWEPNPEYLHKIVPLLSNRNWYDGYSQQKATDAQLLHLKSGIVSEKCLEFPKISLRPLSIALDSCNTKSAKSLQTSQSVSERKWRVRWFWFSRLTHSLRD